jgi:hypothetical protein
MNQPNEPARQAPSGQQHTGQRAMHADPASTISSDIDQALDRRTAPPDTWQGRLEDQLKHDATRVWHALQRRPSVGVVLFGGAAILAAETVGVGEVALGIAIGYAAYRVLRKGHSAIAKPGESVEHG